MSKKKSEREVRAAHRRNRKEKQSAADSEFDDFVSLNIQLRTLGLSLKQVPGDGNCLFRALGDQLDGSAEDHLRHRQSVVDFIRRNREDFEPFVEDDNSFSSHLASLEESGTFGGNDSIVAFARLHDLTVVLHQLNKPLWQIHGGREGRPGGREVHISYHNGDHYNSVRRVGDTGAQPARIRLCETTKSQQTNKNFKDVRGGYQNCDNDCDDSGQESDYENSPSTSKLNMLANEVSRLSGLDVTTEVFDALELNAYSVRATVDFLLNDAVSVTKSNLWSSEGTGSRIFGETVALKAVSGKSGQEKLKNIQQKLGNKNLSNKKRKDLKKSQRKIANNERKRGQGGNDHGQESDTEIVITNVQALTI